MTIGLLHTRAEAAELILIHGKNELQEKSTPKWIIYLQHVRQRALARPAGAAGVVHARPLFWCWSAAPDARWRPSPLRSCGARCPS